MQRGVRTGTWTRRIIAWAMFNLLVFLPALTSGCSTGARSISADEAERPDGAAESVAGRWLPWSMTVDGGHASSFILYQPATSTAVSWPTATAASSTETARPPSTPPTVLPTDTSLLLPPTDVQVPTATLIGQATPIGTIEFAGETASPEANLATPAGEPLMATPLPVPAIQGATTATAIFQSPETGTTTYTVPVTAPAGSLLDRLTRNKPGIWGNKAFYVGLGIVYVVLLALFLGLIFRMAQGMDKTK